MCIKIDLNTPPLSTYRMRGEDYQLQCEGLQDICFKYRKYDLREVHCTPSPMGDTTELEKENIRGEGLSKAVGVRKHQRQPLAHG